MAVRNPPSTSDGPPHPSSPTPTPTTTSLLAEQRQLQRFNETQMLTGSTSPTNQSVGIESDTSAAESEPVRRFETEDEDEVDDGGRGRVLGVFEVDVSITLT